MTQLADETALNINDRLAFIGIDRRTSDSLKGLKAVIDQELPKGLDKFYDKVRGNAEMRAFFKNDAHMVQAKEGQESHWRSITTGKFDGTYVSNVRKIGLTHARIGLEPRWYIAGYALLLEHLIHSVITGNSASGGLFRGGGGRQQLAASVNALVKAVLLDMELAISVYIDAAEEARLESEREVRERDRQVTSTLAAGLEQLAAQDMTSRLTDDLPESYAQLQQDYNKAMDQLEGALRDVNLATGTIVNGSQEISKASDDLSKRTEQQAVSLEEAAASLHEITATAEKSAEGVKQARQVVSSAKSEAENSGEIVGRAVEAMERIEKSSQEISQIIGVIDEIAFQTNLLALNAGVEAARAGEAGRGFAVVAQEVRALAQRSATAAKEIRDLISASAGEVNNGVELVAQTGQSLERIVATVEEINTIIADIASGAQEQAAGMQQVNTTVNQLDRFTQENAAMAEQATAASQSLMSQGNQLANLIQCFRISGQSVGRLPREPQSIAPLASAKPAATHSSDTRRHNGRQNGSGHENSLTPTSSRAAVANGGWEEF